MFILVLAANCAWPEANIPQVFSNGQSWPSGGERANSGEAVMSIDDSYLAEVVNMCGGVLILKFEEGDCSDSKMTFKAKDLIYKLSELVEAEWQGAVSLRITEAWDNNNEHANYSLHYEGRAVDLTTSDLDQSKYPRLASLAARAGFNWVFLEGNHVHVSVSK